MEDLNRDDILFNMVNKHSDTMEEKRKEERRKEEIINYNYDLAQRAIATSLRREEIAKEAAIRGKEITSQRRKKVAIMLVAMATAALLMAPVVKTAVDNVNDYIDTKTAISIMQDEAIDDLAENRLINIDGTVYNDTEPNTHISYQRLDISSLEEVYIYKTILNDTEFNKLIASLGYSSFEKYLASNGFSNEIEFAEKMRENILKTYREELQKNGGKAI